MPLEENEAVVRRFMEEGINGRNFALMDEVFHPDFIWHGGSFGEVRGLENFKQAMTPFSLPSPIWS